MKNLKKSEKILIFILIIIMILYGYFQYILSPELNKLKTAENTIMKYTSDLNTLKIISMNSKKDEQKFSELQAKYNEYVKIIPRSDETALIIRELKLAADKDGVVLNSLTIDKGTEYSVNNNNAGNQNSQNNVNNTKKQEGSSVTVTPQLQNTRVRLMTVPLSINITGGYTGVMNYIKSIEEGTREIMINSVNISLHDKDGSDLLNVSINANILYITDGADSINDYDFNNGNYGKDDPFK